MELLKNWGSEEWSAVAAIVSAAFAIAAFVYTWKSNRESEERQEAMADAASRSAAAAEGSKVAADVSADAARRAVSIQEAQHTHSRAATLHIYDGRTYVIPPTDQVIGTYLPVRFKVKNIGGAEAFSLLPSFDSEIGLKPSRSTKGSLLPQEEAEFGGDIDRSKALELPKPSRATFRLAYQDSSGRHELEAVFELTFEVNTQIPAPIVYMAVDGKPCQNYTNDTSG